MAEVVAAVGFRIGAVVTAVDPALLLPCLGNGDDLADAGLAAAATDRRAIADAGARRLEYAPVLAVAEGPEADAEDRALLDRLHPTALRVPVGDAALARAVPAGFDVEVAAAARHPACAPLPQEVDAHGVATYVWHRHRPFRPGRLYAAPEGLTCVAARSRGRFYPADRPDTPLAWDAAGGALCVESAGPWPASLPDGAWETVPPVRRAAAALDRHPGHGDRCRHLVFTSPGLDRDGLAELLGSCFLADAEHAAGRDSRKGPGSAFDAFLDA